MDYFLLIDKLINGQCWIMDILPCQVPKDSAGQYFAADRYFRQPERLKALYRRFAETFLKVNCYYEMAVSFDGGKNWTVNPDPEEFVQKTAGLSAGSYLRIVIASEEVLIDLDPQDTYATVYCTDGELPGLITEIAVREGFFIWKHNE